MKTEKIKALPQERKWWKESIVYQIYPRSFQDSNGDGIGDLQGIIQRLDYVKSLGVDVIWLNPVFESPNADMGYDISDYRKIMPEFGTMEDFDALLKSVHEHGMKLVLDLVVNHTSDEHPWFVEASKSRDSEYYSYYHWWPAEKGEPPYRGSYFDVDGYAWKYNAPTNSYYLHYFSEKQPDLNWNNPKVREEVYDIMRFWLGKGIDGFRMDSIPLIGKDPSFPDVDRSLYPSIFNYYASSPAMHDYLHEMNREVLSRYDILTVGEGSAVKVEDAWKFVDPSRDELQMLYHFGPSDVRNFSKPDSDDSGLDYSLVEFKRMFDAWDKGLHGGWPVVYLGNHDQPRMVSCFGNDGPDYREYSAKMLATFLLTMRGTVYWYAGDEIGMDNIRFDNIDQYRDIATLNEYERLVRDGGDIETFMETQKNSARDNSRTPFQWDDSQNAGFSTEKPWIEIGADYMDVNVELQERFPDSVLNYFRSMVALRKSTPALVYGDFELINPDDERVFAYIRSMDNERWFIVLNFTKKRSRFVHGLDLGDADPVVHNYEDKKIKVKGDEIVLRPFEALVFKLQV